PRDAVECSRRAAASAEASETRRVGLPALVSRQIAAPTRPSGVDLYRLFAVNEVEFVERQSQRRDRFVARRERFGERGGEFFMIERRFLGESLGVHQDELVSPLDRFAIPEAAGLLDPGGAIGRARDQTLKLFAQPCGALVIGRRSLRVGERGQEKQ